MTVRSRLLTKGGLCLAWTAAACVAQAQTTSRIAGTVVDATGALIVKADNAAQNESTREKRSTTRNELGEYAFSSLQHGTYHVHISAAGIPGEKSTTVEAWMGETVPLNSVLQVATSPSEVTVSDRPTLI